MAEKTKIRFAVIGQGHIGKRHAEMIHRNPDCELVAVCDCRSKEEVGLPDSNELYFSSIDSLLQNEADAIDVVNICVPNGLHYSYSMKALECKKHVVIEKPMTLSKADAEKIISKSQDVSKHIFCVMQNRYSPPSQWLKQVVDQKLLGSIYIVQFNCYWNRDDRYYKPNSWHGTADMDGGVLFTQFSHFIDSLYWLFGDIININADFKDFCHQQSTVFEDSGFVTFDFVNGGKGLLNYSTAVWNKNLESSITVIGEKGTLKVAGQYMNEVVYCDIKDYQMPQLAILNPPNEFGIAQNHQYVIENVVDTLHNGGSASTDVMEELKVIEIIERMYALRDKKVLKNRPLFNK